MDSSIKKALLRVQVDEISAHRIYSYLARIAANPHNSQLLYRIAATEMRHYRLLQGYTGCEPPPRRFKVWFYIFCARVLGMTFALKLMENSERSGANDYRQFAHIPELLDAASEEEAHEMQLIELIDDERLSYMGSVVLGLNDALVEFTGALAGFTLALNNAPLIALTGGITGIAAALSMGSSEYLSTKSEKSREKHPVRAAVYTTAAYLLTVTALIAPFMLCTNVIVALCIMLVTAVAVIAVFNYYYAVVTGERFRRRFAEMVVLSFSVAGLSFLIGYLFRRFSGIDV